MTNVAVSVVSAVIVTAHVLVPVQVDQPANDEPASATALNVTGVPYA